jgi:hypothetical protein
MQMRSNESNDVYVEHKLIEGGLRGGERVFLGTRNKYKSGLNMEMRGTQEMGVFAKVYEETTFDVKNSAFVTKFVVSRCDFEPGVEFGTLKEARNYIHAMFQLEHS